MTNKRRLTLVSGAAVLAALSALALTASGSSAADYAAATPLLAYDLSATAPAGATPAVAQVVQMPAEDSSAAPGTAVLQKVDTASVECMAKVVLHEAANQPREGKIAVAQTLVNRLRAGRFGDTICAVANQKGQFFHIARFRPRRDTNGWQQAVEVAHAVLAGEAEAVAPGAMYFRASYAPANSFFRTRERVATVGAHIFYR